MGRLANLGSNPTIIQYAKGASQAAIAKIAEFLAPTVDVATMTGQYKVYDAKHRFKLPKSQRSVGGRAVQLGFDATDASFNLKANALDAPIDIQESMASEDMESAMMEAADLVAETAGLIHEKSTVDTAVAALVAETPDFSASIDPIKFIDEQILAVLKATKSGSTMEIGILMGATCLLKLKNHPLVTKRIINGKGANNVAVVNEQALKDMFIGNPEVKSSFMVFDDSAEGLAEDIKFLLDTSMIVFARKSNPTRRDPSFMKTFRLRGKWMVPGTYVRDDGREEVAKFDWHEQIAVTNSAAAKLITPNFGS